eukprot:1129732-Lingulodinium_polyedra.AAC.1
MRLRWAYGGAWGCHPPTVRPPRVAASRRRVEASRAARPSPARARPSTLRVAPSARGASAATA